LGIGIILTGEEEMLRVLGMNMGRILTGEDKVPRV